MAKTFFRPPFRRGKTSRAPHSHFVAPPLPVISDQSLSVVLLNFIIMYFSGLRRSDSHGERWGGGGHWGVRRNHYLHPGVSLPVWNPHAYRWNCIGIFFIRVVSMLLCRLNDKERLTYFSRTVSGCCILALVSVMLCSL